MADATIILAGGVGSRLWPASLRHSPKQLLRVGGGPSLIQRAINLAFAATPDGPVVIVTNQDHVEAINDHVGELDTVSPGSARRITFLPEPVGRNTGPAVALGVTFISSRLGADASVLVLTADHIIEPANRFTSDADAACRLACDGNLVCFGILPDGPETGYGYIRAGEPLAGGYRVARFTEKPDLATAERYLRTGGHYWNAGMFCFTAGTFLNELSRHAPEIADAFAGCALPLTDTPTGSSAAEAEKLAGLYERLPKISIDYALMEKCERVAVVPATFSWNDVGSWDEVARVAESLHEPAPPSQPVIEVEAGGNYVASDLPVAICGVSDIHVVVRNGKVLVCRRGRSQLVKQAVEAAEAAGHGELV